MSSVTPAAHSGGVHPLPAPQVRSRRVLLWEVGIVLAVTYGLSGARALLRLIDAALRPEELNRQQVTINLPQSPQPWLDAGLQLVSSATLYAWGGLALYLLVTRNPAPIAWRLRWRDWIPGVAMAVAIGIPGLAFYVAAVNLGLSRVVVPTALEAAPWRLPLLVLNSWGNAFGEEIVVVAWLCTRLRQLRTPVWGIYAGSAVLRGSYHLYQGFSAGVGNIAMGLLCVWYFRRTGRVWPLIIAHGVIDTVAFVGYAILNHTPGL